MILNVRYLFVGVLTLIFIVACSKDDSGPNDPPALEIPNKLYEVAASTIQSINYFPDITPLIEHDVSVHKITYTTTYKSSQTTVSGVVVIPKNVLKPSIIIDCHGTVQSNDDIPSNSTAIKPLRFTQIAAAGYIVFAPDYIGFGNSINQFHPWLVAEPGAEVLVDMITSGLQFLEDYDVAYTNKIFLTGYSEGSNFVLAAQKKIESLPGSGINIVASAPVSGAYDMKMTFTRRINGTSGVEAIGAAYLVLAFRDYYDWENEMTDFFKEPYATEFATILEMPGNFEDNFFNTSNMILTDFMNGALTPSSLLADSFKENLNSAQRMKFDQKLMENNVYDWKPLTPTTLYYGKSDFSTYFENSLNAYDGFISNGADPNVIRIIGFEGRDHDDTESPAMRAALDFFGTL